MKRTATFVGASGFLELDLLADNVDDIQAIFDFLHIVHAYLLAQKNLAVKGKCEKRENYKSTPKSISPLRNALTED